MEERISFFTHKGKSIMLVDARGCSAKEIIPLLDQIQQTVARHERNSLLILADLHDAHLDRAAAQRMKEVLVLDRPFVRRAAWVGSQGIPKAYLDNFKSFSQRDFPSFDTRDEAMDWLVSE
jgi:hypothetical protein